MLSGGSLTYCSSRLRERASTRQAERGFWQQVNLRQHLLRLIERAGLTPWPKLFHNLRSSAQTDLAERFPSHVVCAWLGNNKAVALHHYLQVTDAHDEQATRLSPRGTESGAAGARIETHVQATPVHRPPKTPRKTAPCESVLY